MKTLQQEILDALLANAGNRLTPELITGLQVRINQAFTNTNNHRNEENKPENQPEG